MTGPAGTLLVLATDPACEPDDLTPTLGHLLTLCRRDDRTGCESGSTVTNRCVAGTTTRSTPGWRTVSPESSPPSPRQQGATGLTDELATTVCRLTSWLVEHRYTNAGGMISWPQAVGETRSKPLPQAWCYGTPSVAWTRGGLSHGHQPAAGLPARDIRLTGIEFRYQGGDRPVLDGLDLWLPAGSSLALVGDNGAGKSTIVKLLAGLYDPTAGRITVDDTDL